MCPLPLLGCKQEKYSLTLATDDLWLRGMVQRAHLSVCFLAVLLPSVL